MRTDNAWIFFILVISGLFIAFAFNISLFWIIPGSTEVWAPIASAFDLTHPWFGLLEPEQWAMPHLTGPALLSLSLGVVFSIYVNGFKSVLVKVRRIGFGKYRIIDATSRRLRRIRGPTTRHLIPILPEPWPMVNILRFKGFFVNWNFTIFFEVAWELIEMTFSEIHSILLIQGIFIFGNTNYFGESAFDIIGDIIQAFLGGILGVLILRLSMPFTPSPLVWFFKSFFWKVITVVLVFNLGNVAFLGVIVKRSTVFGLFPTIIQLNIGYWSWLWLELMILCFLWAIDIYTVPRKLPQHYPTVRDRHWFYIYMICLVLTFHLMMLDLRVFPYILSWLGALVFFFESFVLKYLYLWDKERLDSFSNDDDVQMVFLKSNKSDFIILMNESSTIEEQKRPWHLKWCFIALILLLCIPLGLNVYAFFFDGRIDNIRVWFPSRSSDNSTIPWFGFLDKRQWSMPHLTGPAIVSFFWGLPFMTYVTGGITLIIVKVKRISWGIYTIVTDDERQPIHQLNQYLVPLLPKKWNKMWKMFGFRGYFVNWNFTVFFSVLWELFEKFLFEIYAIFLITDTINIGEFVGETPFDIISDIFQAFLGALLGILILRFTMPFHPSPLVWFFKSFFWKIVTVVLILCISLITFIGLFVKNVTFLSISSIPIELHLGFWTWGWIELIILILLWAIDIYTVPINLPKNYPTLLDRHWFYIYMLTLSALFHLIVLDLRTFTFLLTWLGIPVYFFITFVYKQLYLIQRKGRKQFNPSRIV